MVTVIKVTNGTVVVATVYIAIISGPSCPAIKTEKDAETGEEQPEQ